VALRKLYIDRLGLIPDVLRAEEVAYFRSTNLPRTIESLQQVIHGLYPRHKVADGLVPRVRIRHAKDENLMANAISCDRLRELQSMFARATAKEFNPQLSKLDSRLSRFINGRPIRVDGKPRLSGVLDTIRAAHAHQIPVPQDFLDPEVDRILETAVVAEWFSGYKTIEFRQLAMGRLLSELKDRMCNKAKGADHNPLSIAVMSCHDTSLAGILLALDVFDDRWPAFTASVTFELFSESKRTTWPWSCLHKPHFVRMRYQNKTLILPACSAPTDHLMGHPEFCTLGAFQRRVDQLTPKDWEEECAVKTYA